MFKEIQNLSQLMGFVESNPQIRSKFCDQTKMTVVCYTLQDEDTFSGEHELHERECRGITFSEDGTIVSRTLHKFFNIGEKESTRSENLDWGSVTRCMVKKDGSMVSPLLINGKIKFKTKKTFFNNEASLADSICEEDPNRVSWVTDILSKNLTPIFEVTSPKLPIVLLYKIDELTLLHVRENVSGRYLSEDEIIALAPPFSIVENVIDKFKVDGAVSWDLLKVYAETVTGEEGVVIQFGQEMVKLKSVWYCDLHRAVSFTRWRDIAKTVVADQSDDLKGAFVMTNRNIESILLVERTIHEKILLANKEILMVLCEVHAKSHELDPTAKDVALKYKDHPNFPEIMKVFRGQNIDWMDWYRRRHLEADWSLEVVPIKQD